MGVGAGSSVLQVLDAIRLGSGRSIEAEIFSRRPRDLARIVGRVDLIAEELGWSASRGLTTGPLGLAG